jgi:LacI family transcriptional regulator
MVLNDRSAVGAMEALREAGLRIPEDVSVMGFDSTDECNLCTPRLTSMKVPLREIGACGVDLLLRLGEQMEDGDPTETEEVVLATKVEVRGSTAPSPA